MPGGFCWRTRNCNAPLGSTWMLGLGGGSLLLFALGLPALGVALVGPHRKQLNDARTQARLGFMYM